MTTITRPAAPARAALVVAGVAAAGAASAAIAVAALAAGAPSDFPPLQPQVYLSFALGGTLLAIAGWMLVVRFTRRPARLLRILVPGLVALSLVPDVVLMLTGFIPGTTPLAVVALMLMHLVVAGVAVLVAQRIAPATAVARE